MFNQRNQHRNGYASGRGKTRETRHQHNLRSEYGYESNAFPPLPTASVSAPAFDFRRMESFMESMSKSVETLAGRLNALEKGQPSPHMASVRNQARSVPVKPPMATTRPQLSTGRSTPAWQHPTKQIGPSNARSAPATAASSAPTAPASSARNPAAAASSAPATLTLQSDNPDFSQICKSLNRMVQLRRHIDNWKTLPAAITRNIQHVAKNIRPVHPSDELTADISGIFAKAGLELHERVKRHFAERLKLNLAILRQSNPLDKDRAVEVVTKQLQNRLGSKVTGPNLRGLVEGEAKVIGVAENRDRAEVREVVDPDGFRQPSRPAKKQCISTTPPTTTTRNSFALLSTIENDDAVGVEDSPSPPRKTPRLLPKAPSKTHVSFTPGSPQRRPSASTDTTPAGLENFALVLETSPGTDLPPQSAPTGTHALRSAFFPPRATTPESMALETSPTTQRTGVPAQSLSTVSVSRFTDHSSRKKPSWQVRLLPDTEFLILADSNFKYLTSEDIPSGFQVECLHGANFSNTLDLINDLPPVQQLIIAMGINHKATKFDQETLPAMELFFEACEAKTEDPLITVGVSINTRFIQPMKDNLTLVNRRLREAGPEYYISPLASHEIYTDSDKVHYTRDTQLHILHNIIQFTKN